MRLSAFLEAWVQLVLQEGNRVVPKWGAQVEADVPQQGVTELKSHHKVTAVPPQPWARGRIEAVNRRAAGARRSLEVRHSLC